MKIAKDIASRMNQMIPSSLDLTGGLRVIGNTMNPFKWRTDLIYGLTKYNKDDFEKALQKVEYAGGQTPLCKAIDTASDDLKEAKGKIAVIVLSDGIVEKEKAVIEAAEKMKAQYGDRLCLYSVLVGDDQAGKKLMENLAEKSGCGFMKTSSELSSDEKLANFIEKIFFDVREVSKDSDGDGIPDINGIPDIKDKCPNTPKGIEVDLNGCPLKPVAAKDLKDSDGDGVYDFKDRCPDTPKGAKVNEVGCWIVPGLRFETAKYEIKSEYYPALNDAAAILLKNKELKVQIQGHTDNVGNASYNKKLSENRAKAVMAYLIKKGVPSIQISTMGFGFSKPIAPNTTSEGKAKNRRVEFIILP
jgi:OOP family OmpA-OmpF porin